MVYGDGGNGAADTVSSMSEVELQLKNTMVFASTTVSQGAGVGVVVGTGMDTEIGKIQQAVDAASQEEEDTPLQKTLDEFGGQLSKIIGGICLLVWTLNIRNFSDPAFGWHRQYAQTDGMVSPVASHRHRHRRPSLSLYACVCVACRVYLAGRAVLFQSGCGFGRCGHP